MARIDSGVSVIAAKHTPVTQAGEYRRGETVRILDCPLNQQHRDMTGRVIESAGLSRVLCVEMPDGTRCWTDRVVPVQSDGTNG